MKYNISKERWLEKCVECVENNKKIKQKKKNVKKNRVEIPQKRKFYVTMVKSDMKIQEGGKIVCICAN